MKINLGDVSVESLNSISGDQSGNVDFKYKFDTDGIPVIVQIEHKIDKANFMLVKKEFDSVYKVYSSINSIIKQVCAKARESMIPEWLDKSDTVEDLMKSIKGVRIYGGLSDAPRSKYRGETNVIMLVSGSKFWDGHGADVLISSGSVSSVEIGGNMI